VQAFFFGVQILQNPTPTRAPPWTVLGSLQHSSHNDLYHV